MNKSKLLAFALALLSIGNVCAEEVDTLKIVDVEEVLIIAAPHLSPIYLFPTTVRA